MNPLRRACLRTALALAAAPLLSSAPFSAHADAWPQRPIRLLVPYGPGGSSDVVARAVAVEMSRDLGQQVIVENKGGGQGSIATVEAARARPDGYTLILGHVGTLAVNPTMMPNLSYDPRRDFAPIILLAKLPMVFAVGAKVPAATLPEFVALARAKPGVLNYGSAGNGSAGHLAFEMLKTAAAIDVVHVPYKGTGAQVTDLLAGNIDAAAAGIPGLLPHAQAGKIKIVAVGSAQRLPILPDVPTVAEQGYPGFESSQWFGLLAPAGTPQEAISRLQAAAQRALRTDAVRQRLAHDAAEPSGAGPAEFAAFIDAEERRWSQVVKDARLSAE
ncbi:Bug family tripartite tricarboxylate transporter substrate binding protein [Achromobacter xylosoxidans]|uniref:Bug family tripartite tricarboxylate transporter substrate binding protein n=1 Tax=Achromobacter TaxID=222 RepID=UPI0006C2FC5D|nr:MULTISPECIES: tripartite tricarboxylate transporter substrate binding protein [Achromobacter]KAA5925512.1 tripartite tricarboxylate transporter substrate binding protein [Achromobacter xylosoxidans]MCH1993082.1 tripartite tricarboxylate transporter substrate binding protein [Achromobacter xylosoxidans]MCZ8437139.1 tripartite tricarboxylate transporter substrate binding protein [Achromobacter xylosoxidans]OCZ59354.1 ABC transporter substrate-binding protein [Achromobacter xylosoxidans]OFQ452